MFVEYPFVDTASVSMVSLISISFLLADANPGVTLTGQLWLLSGHGDREWYLQDRFSSLGSFLLNKEIVLLRPLFFYL